MVETLPWTSGREALADSSDFTKAVNCSLHLFCPKTLAFRNWVPAVFVE